MYCCGMPNCCCGKHIAGCEYSWPALSQKGWVKKGCGAPHPPCICSCWAGGTSCIGIAHGLCDAAPHCDGDA